MPFTVWMRDQLIGETRFELHPGPRRRGGSFHPTAFGLTVLPGIVDMFPALLAFGQMCRNEGIDINDESPEAAATAMNSFGGSPEGKRVLACAKIISDLRMRDGGGRLVVWESIAISDSSLLAKIAAERSTDLRVDLPPNGAEIVKYLITMTIAQNQPTANDSRRQRLFEPVVSS